MAAELVGAIHEHAWPMVGILIVLLALKTRLACTVAEILRAAAWDWFLQVKGFGGWTSRADHRG